MHILYSDEPFPAAMFSSPSIFLAGPTPRSADVKSWRPDAIAELNKLRFDGFVLVPEPKGGFAKAHYEDQVTWEKVGLSWDRTCIMFWVPRNMVTMPALTTNVEFGRYIGSGRVVYGRPDDAVHCGYLDWMYLDVSKRYRCETLFDTCQQAVVLAYKLRHVL